MIPHNEVKDTDLSENIDSLPFAQGCDAPVFQYNRCPTATG